MFLHSLRHRVRPACLPRIVHNCYLGYDQIRLWHLHGLRPRQITSRTTTYTAALTVSHGRRAGLIATASYDDATVTHGSTYYFAALQWSLDRAEGQSFDCAPWVHKARVLPREQFRREVEKELMGRETEPSELVYFQAVQEPDSRDRTGSRNGGTHAGVGQVSWILSGDDLCRLSGGSQPRQRRSGDPAVFGEQIFPPFRSAEAGFPQQPRRESIVNEMRRPKTPRLRLDPIAYENLRQQVLRRDGWRCQSCGAMSTLEVHHLEFRSRSGDDSELNLITLCSVCHSQLHGT